MEQITIARYKAAFNACHNLAVSAAAHSANITLLNVLLSGKYHPVVEWHIGFMTFCLFYLYYDFITVNHEYT